MSNAKLLETPFLYQNVNGLDFEDTDGNPYTLQNGNVPKVLIFWASWCPDCKKDLKEIDKINETITNAGGELLLINRLDGSKETKQQALEWLDKNQISTPTIFDVDEKNYQLLSINSIPSVLFINQSGMVSGISNGFVPEHNQLLSFIEESKFEKSVWFSNRIADNLFDPKGYLVQTPSLMSDNTNQLQLAQSLFLLYAAESQNPPLFKQCWQTIQSSPDNSASEPQNNNQIISNLPSLSISDFIIYRALVQNNNQRNSQQYAQSIEEAYVHNSRFITTHNQSSTQKPEESFSLSAADFEAMAILKMQNLQWESIQNDCLEIVLNGVISDEVPLFHSSYNYDNRQYSTTEINIAENLLTMLHLAKINQLPPPSYQWIRTKLMQDGFLYANYFIDGTPSENGMVESAAVYGLVAMVAIAENDQELAKTALTRMETLRIRDNQNPLDGFFEDTTAPGQINLSEQITAILSFYQMESSFTDFCATPINIG